MRTSRSGRLSASRPYRTAPGTERRPRRTLPLPARTRPRLPPQALRTRPQQGSVRRASSLPSLDSTSRDRTKGARTMQMAAAGHASVESDPSASAEPPLRQDQPLPRPHGRVAGTVRVLDLPDGGADVAVVMRRRDRPERVVRLHAVHHLVAARAGGPCSNAPQKSRGAEDDEQPNEHVFVDYRTRVRPSSADVDELRDDLAAVDPQFQHRAPRRPPALGRRPRVEDPDTVHELDVRQMGVAEDDGGAAREPSGQPGLAPRDRPRYVHHPDT